MISAGCGSFPHKDGFNTRASAALALDPPAGRLGEFKDALAALVEACANIIDQIIVTNTLRFADVQGANFC